MCPVCLGLTCVLIVSTLVPTLHRLEQPSSSRRDFTTTLAGIHEGASKADVLVALGKPDEVRSGHGIILKGCDETWCYGVNSPRHFPTLGQVFFFKGKVVFIFGGSGSPPSPLVFSEPELRDLLQLLSEAPAFNADEYDPKKAILIVNRLQSLGKERVIAVCQEFLRVAPDWEPGRRGLYSISRVLFDIPERPGRFPFPNIGKITNVGLLKDPRKVPRFPVVLCEDIPLLYPVSYIATGSMRGEEGELEYLHKFAQMRSKRLAPSNKPLGVLSKVSCSEQWFYQDDDDAQRATLMLRKQLLRLVVDVIGDDRDGGQGEDFVSSDDLWRQTLDRFARLQIKWDAQRNRYRVEGRP
jgi:hypothetical protein